MAAFLHPLAQPGTRLADPIRIGNAKGIEALGPGEVAQIGFQLAQAFGQTGLKRLGRCGGVGRRSGVQKSRSV